eukprot:CAMPEP_0114331054 /NCGR_PEP_ID=MMETSP0101-20121206/2157_1 /TAXON_ID=38822 ORGANISM="Pteridomonas danica, Strain PT" /NCGR_SAMPLE_ID=MMETSP0101 /ASSEMBLY_ACC=CAM_ASM_000211 /LENGTH=56 /DNA_ID=CAMNT_0001461261 /DNA_START=25 /DNA_END=191 /DNA_ORIENTATION=-
MEKYQKSENNEADKEACIKAQQEVIEEEREALRQANAAKQLALRLQFGKAQMKRVV